MVLASREAHHKHLACLFLICSTCVVQAGLPVVGPSIDVNPSVDEQRDDGEVTTITSKVQCRLPVLIGKVHRHAVVEEPQNLFEVRFMG